MNKVDEFKLHADDISCKCSAEARLMLFALQVCVGSQCNRH